MYFLFVMVFMMQKLHVIVICACERAWVIVCERRSHACANKYATAPHSSAERRSLRTRLLWRALLATRCCVLLLMAWLLVSVNGQCQSALQAVTNLTNSQTAATVVYRSLNGEQLLVRRDHDRYGCATQLTQRLALHAQMTIHVVFAS